MTSDRDWHYLSELPKMIRHEGAALICGGCLRRWKAPADDHLNTANFDYLCEHVQHHIEKVRDKLGDNAKRLLK